MSILEFLTNSDTLFNIIYYFVPGFISIKLFDRIAVYKRNFSFSELTVYSVIITIISYGVTNVLFGDTLGYLIILPMMGPIIISVILGIILKKTLRKDYEHDTTWEEFIENSLGHYVRISTRQGKNIFGWIYSADLADDGSEYDIILKDPFVYKGTDTENLGTMMYFMHHSIDHITLLKEG